MGNGTGKDLRGTNEGERRGREREREERECVVAARNVDCSHTVIVEERPII